MRNLSKYFENKTIDYDRLIEYGFNEQDDNYIYESKIYNNYFKVIVELSKKKQISRVIDLSVDEEYILIDVKDSSGDFVGQVKEEYENILNDIIEKCSIPNVFKSKQAKEIIKYIKNKYNADLEYLWKKFPNNAVWRNKENKKWFGALLVIEENKIGIESNKVIDIIDLRYQKEDIKNFIDNKKIFAGYHMNKDNWITIKLDESVDIKEIFKLIDNSYNLSLKK